jgi:threonine/homoserine/homoserine lactone efflux protein
MLPVILSVVVISLTGVMTPGPLFAVVLAKSYRSPWAGTQVALGHAVVEVPLILIIYFGFAQFFQYTMVQFVLSLLGGGMIIWTGIDLFRVRDKIVSGEKDSRYNAFITGIYMTGLNPFFLLWWATVGSLLIARFLAFGTGALLIFVPVHWVCDLVWLTMVSFIIYRTQRLWGKRFQEGLFILCSLALVGFGIYFIYSGVKLVI